MSTTTSKPLAATLDDVDLTATIHSGKDSVTVDITVVNRGQKNVYLTDFDLDPKTNAPQQHSLEVGFDSATDTALLLSRLSPLPANTRWAHPPTTYASRVGPRETYRGTVSAPAPLRVAGATQQEPDAEASRVRFELGVIPESPDLEAQPLTLGGKAMYRLKTAAWRQQKVITVETQDLKLPLITK